MFEKVLGRGSDFDVFTDCRDASAGLPSSGAALVVVEGVSGVTGRKGRTRPPSTQVANRTAATTPTKRTTRFITPLNPRRHVVPQPGAMP